MEDDGSMTDGHVDVVPAISAELAGSSEAVPFGNPEILETPEGSNALRPSPPYPGRSAYSPHGGDLTKSGAHARSGRASQKPPAERPAGNDVQGFFMEHKIAVVMSVILFIVLVIIIWIHFTRARRGRGRRAPSDLKPRATVPPAVMAAERGRMARVKELARLRARLDAPSSPTAPPATAPLALTASLALTAPPATAPLTPTAPPATAPPPTAPLAPTAPPAEEPTFDMSTHDSDPGISLLISELSETNARHDNIESYDEDDILSTLA